MITLFNFTLRQTLFERRVLVALLLFSLPLGLAILLRCVDHDAPMWQVWHHLAQYVLLMASLPLVALFYGCSLIASDVESGTIVYLLSRRLRRGTVLFTRYLGVVVGLSLLAALSVIALYAVTTVGVPPEALKAPVPDWQGGPELRAYLLMVPMAVAAYTALFLAVSLGVSKPMVFCGLYVVASEMVVSNLPLGLRSVTIQHQLRLCLTGRIRELARVYEELPRELILQLHPPNQTGYVNLFIVTAAALAVAATLITCRQMLPTAAPRS